MKVNKVNVIYSQTMQWRQFEPIVISQSVEAQVDDGEDLKKVLRRTLLLAREQVDDEIKRLKIARKASADDADSLEKSI